MEALEAIVSEPFYSFLFVGMGMIFLFLEVFIPSGGILGILSMGCSVFGIYGLFHQGRTLIAFASILGIAGLTVVAVKFGLKRLSFSGSLPPETSNAVDPRIEGLIGKEGTTSTALRPAGVAMIDGKRVDVVTQGTFLEANMPVRVIDNSENRVVVREIAPTESQGAST